VTLICHECRRPGAGVLSVHVHDAQPGTVTPWRRLHGRCHNAHGYVYGVDLDDVLDRGVDFWVEHIGGKTWAAYTDYATAFPALARDVVQAAR
jgi:hypothetical protein